MKGQKIGKLLVIEEAGRTQDKSILWRCKCDCGNEVIVRGACLRSGHTTSCGCKLRETTIRRNFRHGESKTSRLYSIWCGIKRRTVSEHCQNDHHWKYYAGKGVTICDEWLDYQKFKSWSIANGYRDDLTIDRIDNDGDYCPENCRWVGLKAQANNKTTNVFITYNGETHTVAQWSELSGINYHTLIDRYNHGWRDEKLFMSTNHDREVICTLSDGTEVHYPSVKIASESTGVATREIAIVCNHPEKRYTAGGYKWRYAFKQEDIA